LGVTKSTVNSLYGTAEFGYKSYLFITATGRNDWFSVLSPENNHYFYPSISGSFVFSEMFKTLPSWLSFGKIRASYADVGSANGANPYSNSLTYTVSTNSFNGQPLGSISNTATPNPNLKPFSLKEKEIGFELRMFNSRVNLDVAAYEKRTTNQILGVAISNASGYTSTIVNLGESKTRGLGVPTGISAGENSELYMALGIQHSLKYYQSAGFSKRTTAVYNRYRRVFWFNSSPGWPSV
jgi:outer membrane receptor protein involved in Fe transport